MDLDYFYDEIDEELDGAIDYIRKAMEIKPMSPSWTPILAEMAKQELNHAGNLYKMAQEYYAKLSSVYGTEMPKCLSDIYAGINHCYTDKVAKAQVLMSLIK